MNTLYEQMVSAYQAETDRDLWNAKYEVTQQITLAGLHRGGFFEKAAFYGGTCLRIFHGLKRFSEDMDFTLLEKDSNTHFENYFEPIIDEFKMAGRDVIITKKEKMTLNKVESAFLKDETDVYNLIFSTEKKVKVKIEIDTKPPLLFDTEQKLLRHPYSLQLENPSQRTRLVRFRVVRPKQCATELHPFTEKNRRIQWRKTGEEGLHGGFETATLVNKYQCGQRRCNPFCRRPPRPRHLVQRLFPAARRDDPVRVRRETRPNYQKMSYKQRVEEKITKKGRPYSKKYYLCDLIFET